MSYVNSRARSVDLKQMSWVGGIGPLARFPVGQLTPWGLRLEE